MMVFAVTNECGQSFVVVICSVQKIEESRAAHFTFSFLYFPLLLPSIMDCTCGAAVVPNTKKTKRVTRREKKSGPEKESLWC